MVDYEWLAQLAYISHARALQECGTEVETPSFQDLNDSERSAWIEAVKVVGDSVLFDRDRVFVQKNLEPRFQRFLDSLGNST